MKRILTLSITALFLAAFPAAALAQFNVDWGTSNDTGNFGFDDLGKWFSDNGYASDTATGANFAKTGYIGYKASDPDAFLWKSGDYQLSLAQQVAGNAPYTSFGVQGFSPTLTGSSGPVNVSLGQDFNLFMNTPSSFNSIHKRDWSTDRSQNLAGQSGGHTTNAGGDPQALIYELNSDEWLVAWEDLDYTNTAQGQSDRDFNDAYLKVTRSGVTVTPEPATLVLFGLGGGALARAAARRRKKKN